MGSRTLVVARGHIGGESFVAALDARTGEERWRSNRDETAEVWPAVIHLDDALMML